MIINHLREDEIFVFGSNTQGRHGAGAARQALRWGAQYGVPSGIQGRTYAVVTKDLRLGRRSISMSRIQEQLLVLIEYASEHPNLNFLLTPIGCGLGGYQLSELEAILPPLPNNILPTWKLV
tara:strand:- start:2240 stop:2605 length:366 start_codon:yes stop_codon:yes gene_type:complete